MVEKTAVWTVSGTAVGVPFATVTQTFGATLVFAQPVWNPRAVPVVVPVTLYIAVNRRPVVVMLVRTSPGAEAAASSIVSIESVLEQMEPCFRRP
jgi:hypothetical protein